jgi:hypothetical protein
MYIDQPGRLLLSGGSSCFAGETVERPSGGQRATNSGGYRSIFWVKFVAKNLLKIVGCPDWVVSIIVIEHGEHPDIFIIASHPILESCAHCERLRE